MATARVNAPMQATVLDVMVATGDAVHADTVVLVLEAMKMEHNVRAGTTGYVRDVAVGTFCEIRSASIQELVHQIGVQLLDAFPEIATVDFYAENRLWDTAQAGEGAVVHTDARPPFGVITLTLGR